MQDVIATRGALKVVNLHHFFVKLGFDLGKKSTNKSELKRKIMLEDATKVYFC